MLKFKTLTALLMTIMLMGCFNKKEAFKEIKKVSTKGLKTRLGTNYERFVQTLKEGSVEELRAILDEDPKIIEGYPLIKLMKKMKIIESTALLEMQELLGRISPHQLNFLPISLAQKKEIKEKKSLMLNYKVEINVPDKFGDTPLHLATLSGCPEIVEILIEKGANVNVAREDGNTVLMYAAEGNNPYIMGYLLKKIKKLPNALKYIYKKNKSGDNALLLATSEERVEAAKFLVEVGADIEVYDSKGLTTLIISGSKYFGEMRKKISKKHKKRNHKVTNIISRRKNVKVKKN